MTQTILVVDDDPQITSLLKRYFSKQGFETLCAASGHEMRGILAENRVDICVLDVGLPDVDGFALTREIRRSSDLPIIVLSVRDETYDRVLGLEFGADDYVTKPFEPRELVARIKTVLRRAGNRKSRTADNPCNHSQLIFGNWIMDLCARTLVNRQSGKEVCLTSMEFELLKAFATQPHTVLSRSRLLDLAHGPSAYVGDRAIDVHIMRLRKKIETDAGHPEYIKTIHGTGYCLVQDVMPAGKAPDKPTMTDEA